MHGLGCDMLSCCDTLANSHLNLQTGPEVVATDAKCRKQLKYEAVSQTHCFIPLAVETLGTLGKEATAFLKDLGRRIAVQRQMPGSHYSDFLAISRRFLARNRREISTVHITVISRRFLGDLSTRNHRENK